MTALPTDHQMREALLGESEDVLKHNYTRRTEAERSERDKLAVPPLVKAKAALQVSDIDEPKGPS
jgi:hypothetical protein